MTKNIKFLVVDDDVDIREILCLMVSEYFEAEFVEASTGFEAVELLSKAETKIDFIISDYNMPLGSGGDFYAFVKKNRPTIPFLLVTSDSLSDHPQFMNDKLTGYLQKPFRDEHVELAIKSLLSQNELLDQVSYETIKYLPIPLGTLRRFYKIAHPLYLKLSDDKFIKITKENTEIDLAFSEKLISKGIESLYLSRDVYQEVIAAFKNSVLNEMLYSTIHLPQGEIEPTVSKAGIVAFNSAIEEFGFDKEVAELAKKNFVIVENLVNKSGDIQSLLKTIREPDKGLAKNHSLLLTLFCTAIEKQFPTKVKRAGEILTTAAYFHDISLDEHHIANEFNFIHSIEIGTPINRIDQELIKSHPLQAIEFLKSWSLCPSELYDIIVEHHERPDGKGFPSGKKSSEINDLSVIFILAHEVTMAYSISMNKGIDSMIEYLESRKQFYKFPRFEPILNWLIESF